MNYLHEKCDLDISWMERLQQIRYDISQQKNLFDAAFCVVKGLMNAGFDRIGLWTYNVGDDAASNLLGVDDYGKIYSNPQEFLPSDSIPPIYGYTIEIDRAIIKEKLGIDDTMIFLQKDRDEDTFANIWGYPPPYPGYYKRDVKGDNICLRTSEDCGKILIMSVDNFISERIIDHISANFIHLLLIEIEKVLIDISLKEAIIQSESKNKAILDAIPDLMFRMTKDGVIIDYKDADQNEFYISKEKIVGSNIRDVLPLDMANQTQEYILKALDSGIMQVYEYKLPVPKGTRDYESRMVVCGRDEVLAMVRDITEHKQMEEQLRKSEEKYRLIFQLSPEAILILDKKGNVQDINEKTYDWIGYKSKEFIGKNILKLPFLTKKSKLIAMQNFFQRIIGKEIQPYELEFIAKDKKTHIIGRVVANPIRDENGKIVQDLVMISNITDQKMAENALLKAYDDLDRRVKERTMELTKINEELKLEITKRKQIENVLIDKEKTLQERLKVEEQISTDLKKEISERKRTEAELARSNNELQQFAYIASHDLQEPLRMVASYLQLLERRYKSQLDADADDFISYAVDGATRMQRLINDLLVYSRVSSRGKEFKPIDCEEILGQTLANLQIAIMENEVTVTHDHLPVVIADDVQMVQIFQNLIANAIKFRKAEPPHIHVSAERKDSEWVFSVRDNGIGIDAEYKDRIFIIFQRLHNIGKYPGTGIGLAVCKRIVERHGGRIWVESQPGDGSSFFFTIQIKKELDINGN